MKRTAIYCRLSEEDRNKLSETDDSNSIANQKAMLLQYANEQGWAVYDIYSDDDYAGADRNRPEFNRLLADAQAKRFDIVLCKTQSRFTRELELVEKYIHGLFPLWGVRFVSVVDNADTENRGNKKSRQINGLVNEWYLEDMSENIKSVLTNRRENGFHIGAFALYGYKKDPERKGRLIIDEEAAAVVREVFALFLQGWGKTAIARMLNDRGVPNPTEYKRLHGLRYRQPARKNSTLWKYFAISNMLTNEIYIGNMVQGKYGSVSYKTKLCRPRPKADWYRVEGTHAPIIDRATWERAQALVAERTKPFSGGTVGLFARKAVCANCGYAMRSSKTRGEHYLQCGNRHVSKDACIGAFISVKRLEQTVLKELHRLTNLYLDRAELERSIARCSSLQARCARIRADIAAYERKIAEHQKGMRDLYTDKVKGLITEADFQALRKDFAGEKERLEQLSAELQRRAADIDAQIDGGNDSRALIERYTHPDRLTREMVDAFIDHIRIGKRIAGTRNVPVEIHWQF